MGTVKNILDATVDELGILRPNGYVGAADIQSRQLVALFHSVGDYLVNAEPWQELVTLYNLDTVPNQLGYFLPAFWSGMVDETHWNSTRKLRIYGRNEKDWSRYRAMNFSYATNSYGTSASTYMVKQIKDNALFLQPTPTTVDRIFYYYYTSAWVGHPTTSPTDRLIGDDDTVVWNDDRMMILGVKAAWLRAKRLSYDEEWSQFQERIRTQFIAGQDLEDFNLDPSCPAPGSLAGGLVVPAGNWNV